MLFRRLELNNWRNFREIKLDLGPRVFVIGANASGKSNLFDVFRFLRTVARPDGGGLQKAVRDRGGINKLRSLHAQTIPEIRILVELGEPGDSSAAVWTYELIFSSEASGPKRILIQKERVVRDGVVILERPTKVDRADKTRLTQTSLEQINSNQDFRVIAEHFSNTTYLHLVPQLLKFGDEISGRIVEEDPFGQGLLQRIAGTPQKTRAARLRRISDALKVAVPQFSDLRFVKDSLTGAPHLEARFQHWRGNGAWQREEQFSDGTLRLLGLLWALQERDGLLLIEEPELSLNDAIVSHLPLLVDRVLRDRKQRVRQVLLSTHSDKLIEAVPDPDSVVLLEPAENGTSARRADESEREAMEHGLNPAEVLLPKTRPGNLAQLGLFG